VESILGGLIWLLIYALVVALVCYVVTRILAVFAPPAAAYGWIVWCIGGLLLLILALRLFGGMLPSPP
jgi:hypothetical protein